MTPNENKRPEVSGDEAFLDTSVFLNRIQKEVEGNKGSVEVFADDSLDKTIGSVAKEELEDRCNVRKQVYRDIAVFVNSSSNDEEEVIYQYETRKLDRDPEEPDLTKNDIEHIHQLQHHIAEEHDKPAYTLRRYAKFFRTRRDELLEKANEFPNEPDAQLATNIGDAIENRTDGRVLAQAVKWKSVRVNNENKDVDTVVSDDNDMHGNEEEINEAIEQTRNHSRYSNLSLLALTDFKQVED